VSGAEPWYVQAVAQSDRHPAVRGADRRLHRFWTWTIPLSLAELRVGDIGSTERLAGAA
jgi:hypothetical protein